MPFRAQRVRDPVHNIIEFANDEFDDAMWRVIQTRPFQRLRRIKQLGFSEMVYPGASHTRLAHSIGVFQTARELVSVIKRLTGNEYQESKARPALAAALVHDVGHGPFSHAFEAFGKRFDLALASHETVSTRLIRDSEISEALKLMGRGFHDDVGAVIAADAPQSVYDAVVSSQFDADRLDYMRRDRMMSGSQHGVIDYKWLVSNLRIAKVPVGIDDELTGEAHTFVIDSKAIYAAETYVLGLFQLYPTIYFHKATRGVEKLFTEVLARCYELCKNGSGSDTGLPDHHPLIRFFADTDNLELVLDLDDSVFMGALSLMSYSKDEIVSSFSTRIRDRHLLRCFDLRVEAQKIMGHCGSFIEASDKIDAAALLAWSRIEEWKTSAKRVILSDKYERSPYKPIQPSKGPLNQILVQEHDGSLVDLRDRSLAVAAIKSFKFNRFYYEADDSGSLKIMHDILKEECKNVLQS